MEDDTPIRVKLADLESQKANVLLEIARYRESIASREVRLAEIAQDYQYQMLIWERQQTTIPKPV